jgi:hypothetical protein
MMRFTKLFLIIIAFSCSNIFAQVVGGTDEKLAKLYNSGKYESCLFKADGLTLKEGTSNDPEPYLYAAMCFFELSKSEDPIIREDYKDGVKQAIKYANKFAKKDKENELYSANIEFINTLKEVQYTEVKGFFDAEDYKKAATSAKFYDKLNKEEDFLILYFVGICEILSKNVTQGNRSIDEAKTNIQAQLKAGTLKVDPKFKTLISSGFMKYSESLVDQNQLKEASACLDFALKILPNDGFLRIQSNMINKKLNP